MCCLSCLLYCTHGGIRGRLNGARGVANAMASKSWQVGMTLSVTRKGVVVGDKRHCRGTHFNYVAILWLSSRYAGIRWLSAVALP